MKRKNGFTLLELLVAATIISALAVLATVSYRASVSEARIQAAKGRTDMLAMAVQQFRLDYGASKLGSGMEVRRLETPGACAPSSSKISSLFECGYLENDGGWDDLYVEYFVCNGNKTASTPCAKSTISAPLACMSGRNSQSKLQAKYKYSNGYVYCVASNAAAEKMGS